MMSCLIRYFTILLMALVFTSKTKANQSQLETPVPPETTVPESLAKMQSIYDVVNLSGSAKDLYDSTAKLLEAIRDKTRDNQEVIFDTVRQLENSLILLENESQYSDFRTEVQATFSDLKKMATEKDLNSNDNLNRIVKRRIPRLLVDMMGVISDANQRKFSKLRTKHFIEDLSLINEVYSKTKRFTFGLGVSYSYLPRFRYDNLGYVDLTPYLPLEKVPNQSIYESSIGFSPSPEQKGYLSTVLSAEIKYLAVQFVIPMHEETITSQSRVRFKEITNNNWIAYRNEVTSKIKIEYDISMKASARDVIQRWYPWHSSQFDYGLGYGLTSIKIKDSITTDLRFSTDNTASFNQLSTQHTTTTSDTTDFLTQYWLIYAKLEVSDDFEIGLDFKQYESKSIGSSSLDVDDAAISLSFLRYF